MQSERLVIGVEADDERWGMKKIVHNLKWRQYEGIPNAVNAIRVGNLLFLSGCSALDHDGRVVGRGDIEAQTKQTMENIKATLHAAGASFENVAHMDTFYVQRETIPQSVRVRSTYFSPDNPYTTTGVIVSGFSHPDLLIEIDAIAVFDD
jgi:enamine deaminase RidA (YjgF/YER057c/UK114 family)